MGSFQGQWISESFESLVFKGCSHKLVFINQGFFFFNILFLSFYLGFVFCFIYIYIYIYSLFLGLLGIQWMVCWWVLVHCGQHGHWHIHLLEWGLSNNIWVANSTVFQFLWGGTFGKFCPKNKWKLHLEKKQQIFPKFSKLEKNWTQRALIFFSDFF